MRSVVLNVATVSGRVLSLKFTLPATCMSYQQNTATAPKSPHVGTETPLVTQVCDTVDFPQCHCHYVQQVGLVFLWLSISSGPHSMAYVLLLGFGIRSCQDGLRGDYQYELRDVPQVGCQRVESNTKCALQSLFYILISTFRAVVPIGACYAGTLWLGNAAYLYLSVSFIQMLKV